MITNNTVTNVYPYFNKSNSFDRSKKISTSSDLIPHNLALCSSKAPLKLRRNLIPPRSLPPRHNSKQLHLLLFRHLNIRILPPDRICRGDKFQVFLTDCALCFIKCLGDIGEGDSLTTHTD